MKDEDLFRCPSCGAPPREIPTRDGSQQSQPVLLAPRGETVIDMVLDTMMLVKRVALEATLSPGGDPAVLTGALGSVRVTSLRIGYWEMLDEPVPVERFQDGYADLDCNRHVHQVAARMVGSSAAESREMAAKAARGVVAYTGTGVRVRLENHTDAWCVVVVVAHGKVPS